MPGVLGPCRRPGVLGQRTRSTSRISFANLDGTGGADLSTAGATTGPPRGVAIDVAPGRSSGPFRTTTGSPSRTSTEAAAAGTEHQRARRCTARTRRPSTRRRQGLLGERVGDRISFANLDNTGGAGNLIIMGATTSVTIGPIVDSGDGKVELGERQPTINVISFANLDGSGGGDMNTGGATVDNPHGLALDPVTDRIYWAERRATRRDLVDEPGRHRRRQPQHRRGDGEDPGRRRHRPGAEEDLLGQSGREQDLIGRSGRRAAAAT